MSSDQQPSERQRLRHQLRDLHRMLTPDAPRAMTTSARARAIIDKLQELAGDRSVGGSDVSAEAAERAANGQASSSPRRGQGEASRQPRSRSRAASRAGASSAAGVAYTEPDEPADEPERERGIDALIRWFREGD